jgi:hypothetical protein
MAHVPFANMSNMKHIIHIDKLGIWYMQFPLYTLMVLNDWKNGVLVAYIMTSSSMQLDLEP